MPTVTPGHRLHPIFTVLLWIGVATVISSFLVLVAVLVMYFMGFTPPAWTFAVTLFAFPVGFIFLLVYLVAAAFARRRANAELR